MINDVTKSVCIFSNDDLKLFVHSSSSQYTSPDLLLGYGIPDFSLAYQLSLKKIESEKLRFKYDNDFRALELISDFIQNMRRLHDAEQFPNAPTTKRIETCVVNLKQCMQNILTLFE